MVSDSQPLIPRWAAGLWSHSACQVHFTYPLMITGLSLGTDMLSTPSDHERAVPVLRAFSWDRELRNQRPFNVPGTKSGTVLSLLREWLDKFEMGSLRESSRY